MTWLYAGALRAETTQASQHLIMKETKTHFYMTWLYAVAMRAETTHASQHLTMKEAKTPFITWLHFDTHQMQEFPSKP